MKKSILKLSMMILMASIYTTVFAQTSTYERNPGYWTFGINGGFAYQDSDIPELLDGYGLGFTLGKNLYYRPGAGLAFDLRGRALYTKTYGLDHSQSLGIENNPVLNGTYDLDYTKLNGGPGFIYQNNKTDHVELGLEGVVTFNKLRENTNVILSLFGGVGLDWYNTKTDQADYNGIYSPQYESLDPTASVSYKKSQLQNAILDGIYETNAQGFENGAGRLGIMPGLGVELGYQFTPRFSMGIGHKVTFTKTDLFDGQQWTDDNRLTGDNDIHHYTNLHMRWIIQEKEKEQKPPVIRITKPEIDPLTTRNPNGQVKATIKNVTNAMDVRMKLNGYDQPFDFKNERFSSTFRLQPGRNDILITASNLAGTDQETVVIFYEEPIYDDYPQDRRPVVNITNPPYDNFRTDNERFVVKATISNVYDKNDISFTVDGRAYRNFNFDNRTNTFSATINLNEGYNEVRIEARNNAGNDVDETTIILERVFQQLPVVEITKPYDNPHFTTKTRVVLEASIFNVSGKQDIGLIINGRRTYDFTFANDVIFANIDLDDYKTIVVVEGNNEAGTATDEIVIFLEEQDEEPEEPVIEAPVVTITSMSQPTVDPFDPDNCKSTVIATILNIENAQDISFILNGKKYYDFDFNPTTGVLKKTVKLEVGQNEVVIKAQNEAGNDQDRATKRGCEIEENPPVVTITKPGNPSTKVDKPNTKITATILNVESKNAIDFTVNGRKILNYSFDANTKVLKGTISLMEGKNIVRIAATNKDGTTEDNAEIVYKKPVIVLSTPPHVAIQSPVNNSKTKVNKVSLTAEILNIVSKSDIEVFLNGNRITAFNFNQNTQKVVAQLSLRKGTNTILIKATNKDGIDSESVKVLFEPPVTVLPEVKFTKPAATSSTTRTPNASVSAVVKNVRTKSDIKLTINGKTQSVFTLNNNVLNVKLKLKEGQNTIRIVATNRDGSAEDQRVIDYKIPVNAPIVTFTTPRSDLVTEKSKIAVKATIQHVILKKDVKLLVNDKATPFTFARGILSAEMNLAKGKNIITIKATNEGGSDEKSVTVTHAPLLPKPTVKFTSPSRKGFTVKKEKTTVEAIVMNVSHKNDITFKVNGKPLRSFNFNPKTNKVSATITLNAGENNVSIEGRNKSGSANAVSSVKYEKTLGQAVHSPSVQINSVSDPTTDPFNPHKAKSTIIAKMEHVTAKDQITFTVNGKPTTSFSYNTRTQTFQTTINVKKGKTKVKIKVDNSGGSNEASRTITF